ncbi:MAG: hypothetical protein NC548_40330 [Lachnospiraceae bacterium]|nr:hypothetical protein [Lachnospiraceae bacterium]
MAFQILDLVKDKVETLFTKINDNFTELYQDKTQQDSEIQQLGKSLPLSGLTDPTAATVAKVGQIYTNVNTGNQFTCVSITKDEDLTTYHWLPSNAEVLNLLQGLVDGKVDWSRFSNPNLLDNWYFLDPINQRGLAAYNTDDQYNQQDVHYTIDRWAANASHQVEITSTGIKIQVHDPNGSNVHGFYQVLEESLDNDSVFTLSLLYRAKVSLTKVNLRVRDRNGVLLASSSIPNTDGDLNLVSISGKGPANLIYAANYTTAFPEGEYVELVAIKLELGDLQTLARKDESGNWILRDPVPNRTLELQKCKRYFMKLEPRLDNQNIMLGLFGTGAFYAMHQFPVEMRTTPTLEYSEDALPVIYCRSGVYTPVTGPIALTSASKDIITLRIAGDFPNQEVGDAGVLKMPLGFWVSFSADL